MPDFALTMRDLQRPKECRKRSKDCWVRIGFPGCNKGSEGAMRCLSCRGKVRILAMNEFQREYAAWLREKLQQEAEE